jgi:hypothetical protein
MHVDKLEYGWWNRTRGNVVLPTSVGDTRNYVLTVEELAAYLTVLNDTLAAVEKEKLAVAFQLRAMEQGRLPTWEQRSPRCTTLAHVMEFLVSTAKNKLALMHVLLDASGKRIADKAASPPVV